MYTTSAPRVHDQPGAYGPYEVDAEAFPAAHVLHDLGRVPDADAPRVLARYAALRCWLLRGADRPLARHAAVAARRYLGAIEDWREGALLTRLVDGEPEPYAVSEAARMAAGAGHREGAYALLRAGYLAARRARDLAWAARMAGRIAALLETEGLDGAPLWKRRAERLRRLVGED